jgi:hypothetical protein
MQKRESRKGSSSRKKRQRVHPPLAVERFAGVIDGHVQIKLL